MLKRDDLPRGMRNNNPFNIKEGSDGGAKWNGELSYEKDNTFEEFQTPLDGLRAGAIILRTYFYKYNLRTVRDIINRFAPSIENHTSNYINFVCKQMNVNPDEILDLEKHILGLSKAIVQMEQGHQYFTDETYITAFKMAGIYV